MRALGQGGGSRRGRGWPLAVAVALGLLISTPSWAVPGGLDPTFGINGIVSVQLPADVVGGAYLGTEAGVVIQPDGKIVVAFNGGIEHHYSILRLLSDGAPDPSFGMGGIVSGSANSLAADVAIQPDGKIAIVAGPSVWRYLSNGSPDPSFGTAGEAPVPTKDFPFGAFVPTALAIQTDGKIIVVGKGGDCGSDACGLGVVRFLPDGSPDPAFGGNGTVYRTRTFPFPQDVAVQPDGKILIVGQGYAERHGQLVTAFGVDRLTQAGTFDRSFAGDGRAVTEVGIDAEADAIAITSDGAILVGGAASFRQGATSYLMHHPDFALVCYSSHGYVCKGFGRRGRVIMNISKGFDAVYGIAVAPTGEIVMAGGAGSKGVRNPTVFAVAVCQPDGDGDPAFGGQSFVTTRVGTEGWASDVAVQPDGKIVVAGFSELSAPDQDGVSVIRYLVQ